jgi:hypothetical protein
MTGDPSIFGNILAFSYLPPSTGGVFPPISAGRWLLFALPAFSPLFLVPAYVILNFTLIASFRVAPLLLATSVYSLNIFLCYRLFRAMKWIGDNRKHQERLSARIRRGEFIIAPDDAREP